MTNLAEARERLSFDLPAALEAREPPEARGLTRDTARMLVTHTNTGSIEPSSFVLLPQFLDAGDLVVVNTSATIPAAVDAVGPDGTRLVVHLSTELDDGSWAVEPRQISGKTTTRWVGPPPPRLLTLAGGARLVLHEPYGRTGRLWIATLELGERTLSWLAANGRPIRYGYIDRSWPIESYQNVYASEPGSAEMPSAGRPFTPEVITRLVTNGVGVAPIVLHTGVASLEPDERPYPEKVRVPETTAERVNAAHFGGHSVLGVGTTVVRALETSVGSDGRSHAYNGWTDLVVTPERGIRITDGLLTGWHEPESSHLLMLQAFTGMGLLRASYRQAVSEGYLWHEFGDVHLILP